MRTAAGEMKKLTLHARVIKTQLMDWVVSRLLSAENISSVNCLGYISTSSDDAREAGISYVHCNGSEEKLGECEFGNLTSHNCSFLGTALCLNGRLLFSSSWLLLSSSVPQVLFSNNGSYNPVFIELSSETETAGFCIDEWGPLSQPLHVLVETIDRNAVGKSCVYTC